MKKRIAQLVLIVLFGATTHAQTLSFKTGTAIPGEVSTQPVREVNDGADAWFEITYRFSSARVHSVEVGQDNYQFLSIDGFAQLQIPGAPAVPVHSDLIAMPEGAVPELQVIDAQYHEYKGYAIHPALQPALDTEGAPEPEFYKDPMIYGSNRFYPESAVAMNEPFLMRGIPVAGVRTNPVLFNPVTGTIRVYTFIRYRIVYHASGKSLSDIAQKNSERFTRQLKQMVINHKSIPDGQKMTTPKSAEYGPKNYIIITHDAFLGQAEQLAEWKRQLGYAVEIVSKDSWTSSEVKNEIQTRYDMWVPHPDYFVILGDHTGPYAVPGNVKQDPYYGDTFVTDLDYACMDGSSDWHPDLAHGRISVATVAEAETVIDKIVNYEQEPVDDPQFYTDALTCAQFQDDDNNGYADRRFLHTSEDINQYLSGEQGYNAERIYYTSSSADKTNLHYNDGYYSNGELLPAVIRTTGFNWSGGAGEITAAINQGKFIVFHRDHGYVGGSGWAHPYYTTGTMDNLANGILLPVVFSINCHTGEYQLDNCFAEKLLRLDNKGAVGVVAAAYYSFSGYNDALSIGMIDAIWPNPGLFADFGSGGTGNGYTLGTSDDFLTMGEVVNQGLYAMEANWGGTSSSNRYQYQLFHWFGDPAMKVWTANPNDQPITASHPDQILCSENTFNIVDSEPGALATLVFNDDLLAVTTMDETGKGTLDYELTVPADDIILTISKHNHLTYEANLVVTGSCNYPPLVSTGVITGQSTTTATVNGSIENDFGSAVMVSGVLFNTSPDVEYGLPGVEATITDPLVSIGSFQVEIGSLDPDQVYYYRAFAATDYGIGYGDVMYFTSLPPVQQIPCAEDFENNGQWPAGWETDNESVWGMRTNWHGAANPGGYHVYSDYTPSGTGTVFSPVFDGSGQVDLQVSFYHYWQADYPGYTQDGYFYGSTDGGNTWPYLVDEWHHNDPPYEEGEQVYDISDWADGKACIAFKWVVTHNNDWYWEFDNFELKPVTQPGRWLGLASTDWADPDNWSGQMIPGETTNVVIPASLEGNFYPETNSGGGAVCNDLLIEAGAHLYVPSTGSLTVLGFLENLAGENGLVLKADAPGNTGSLLNFNPGVEGTVECYLTQMRWHFIGSPVENELTGVFYLPGQSDIYMNTYVESSASWGPWIVSTTDPLIQGKGYECFVDDNVNQDEIVRFKGMINSGDYTTGVDQFCPLEYTPGNGLNLIANPYPSAIIADIDNWDRKNVAATVWAWNEADGNYLFWNGDNGINPEGWGTLNNGVIPAMQGFFVLATSSDARITIPQSSRIHSDIAFYKSNQDLRNALRISADANGYHDEIYIGFNESASDRYEPERDVKKLYGLEEAPQLYSYGDGEKLSINLLKPEIRGKQVTIGFHTKTSSAFKLSFEGIDQFDLALPIYLVDFKTGEIYDLHQTNTLTLNYDPLDDPARFKLCFGENALPDPTASGQVRIYAFGQTVTVHSSSDEIHELMIFDFLGKRVYSTQYLSTGSVKINPGLASGNYLVKLLTPAGTTVQKIHLE